MSPTKTNALESVRPRKVSTQKQRKAFKQRKIPKTLDGVPVYIYGAKMDDFINGDTTIQPLVVSESALTPSSLNVTTPQDTVNLASSCLPPANLVPSHSQIPVSTRVYRGAEPSQAPLLFQHGPDFNSQAEDIFSLTNNPCQSYGRYDPSYYFLPPSSSTGSLSIEQDVEPYQHWVDPNTQYFIPQPILPYVSNASSTFPGHSNSDNDIYAEFTGSPHLTMTSTNDGTPLPLAFPNYDANNLHSYYK